ncbi:hypothetical protein ABZ532_06780 [Streptomyces sp. NPDC019396]|uniref:hypothetical protein n=1 Tax=Streptomyces sp. NPDC019396 TaxID=3154687 RepID=UPI0033F1CBFE
MAGESPDKSEQQKSSGETASSERDPRLAMIRAAGDPPRAEGRADQATAVFRVPPALGNEAGPENAVDAEVDETGTEGEDDAKAASGSQTSAEEPGEPEERQEREKPEGPQGSEESDGPADTDADTADDGDDARLRNAVASWVSAAEEDAEAAEESTSKDAGPVAEQAEEPEADDEPAAEHAEESTPADDEPVAEQSEDAEAAAEGAGTDDESDAHDETDEADESDASDAPDESDESDESGEPGEGAEVAEAADSTGSGDGSADDDPAPAPKGSRPDAPVDQATAVFKVPPRRRVDQPTTALKITKPESKPEPESERTSRFVPLRRDGSPASPPAPAPARPSAPAPGPPAPAAPAASTTAPPASPARTPVSLTEPERTKQQPLPPRPPLDLLAELTNTPPPPQTPLRTTLRRVRIWTPLVVLLLIVFAIVQMVRPLPTPTLALTAKSSYTFEGSAPQLPWPARGQAAVTASGLGSLGTSGEQKPVPIASVTKAMTAYVILEKHPLKRGEDGPMIEIDAKGEQEGQLDKTDNESTLNTVKQGDKISLRDALSAIMIPSANNIARQLARWDSGSEAAFVEKMNAAAGELGMTNTTYTDPSGLQATTVSTAEDQVKLGLKLVEIPALMDITKLPKWKDHTGKEWRNYNDLVPYDGALGIKTGSTTKAGGNLLFAAHKMVGDTDQFIVGAVLSQHDVPILGTAINASKEVMLATQEALKNATIVKKGQVVGAVEDGLGGSVPVVATKDVTAVGWSGLTVKLKLTDGGKTVPHVAKAGTAVGTLAVGEGASQVKVPVVLQSDLAEPGAGEKLTRVS